MLLSWARRMAHGGWPGRVVLHVRQHSAAWCFSRAGDRDQAWRGCCLCGARGGAVARWTSHPEAVQRDTRAHDASHLMGWARDQARPKSRVSDAVGADETANGHAPAASSAPLRNPLPSAWICARRRHGPTLASAIWGGRSPRRASSGNPAASPPVTLSPLVLTSATGPMGHSRLPGGGHGPWGFGGITA